MMESGKSMDGISAGQPGAYGTNSHPGSEMQRPPENWSDQAKWPASGQMSGSEDSRHYKEYQDRSMNQMYAK